MTTLLRPDNKQPAAYVTSRNGHICLRTTCITPSVMWFSDAAMNQLNPVYTCEPPPADSGLLYDQPQPCRALVLWKPIVILTPAQAASVNFAAGVEIRIAA